MKLTRKSNFRIVVEPRRLGDYGFIKTSDSAFGRTEEDIEKEYLQRCREIEDDIKRHVDNVDYIGIEYDTHEECSHCGLGWELSEDENDPDFPVGCPVCCDTAAAEWKASVAQCNN